MGKALTIGRDDIYWLRLRAYCQAIAGQTAAAHLTFDLAQAQAKDAAYGRLMGAKLAGGAGGAASLRNGLELALSRSLGLDLAAAKASPAVAAALGKAPPEVDAPQIATDLAIFADMISGGRTATQERFFINGADPKIAARMEPALLLAFSFGPPQPSEWAWDLSVREGKAPLARNLALQSAAERKHVGMAALLALWTSAEAGAAGPSIGDRVRIVMALHAVGLEADARAFALEGLAALK